MSLIVQKYGGSSVADADKMKNVARRAIAAREKGNQVVVVISAMGDTTDDLIELAHQITSHPDEREMDVLLSTGEIVSSTLLSMAIKSFGQKAISLSGGQAGIQTDGTYSQARIRAISPQRVKSELDAGNIVVVISAMGDTTDDLIDLAHQSRATLTRERWMSCSPPVRLSPVLFYLWPSRPLAKRPSA